MARKRKKQPPADDLLLDEIDRFLEDGVDGLSPSARRRLEVEQPPAPPSSPPPSGSQARETPVPSYPTPRELELVLLENGLKAVVRAVHPHTAATDILDLLERHAISFGIDKSAILKAVDTARRTGQSLKDVVVAQGQPAQPPPAPRLDFCLPPGLETLPSLDPLRRLLLLQDRTELLQAAVAVQGWAVGPEDRLAVKVISGGKEGTDVQGHPIPAPGIAPEKTDPRLQPGQGVRLAPNGVDYLTATCGYAGLENGRIAVLEPIWIAPDRMAACFLKLPLVAGSRAPAPQDLHALLKASGVSFGIDPEAVAALCQRFASLRPALYPLARGEAPQSPVDAAPSFGLDFAFRIGTFRPDGSVDFRERNLFPPVKEGTRLIAVSPPMPGRPGHDVHGEEISIATPLSIDLVPGENVRLEQEGETAAIYATADGGATLKTQEIRTSSGAVQSRQYTVAVQPVGRIDSDVGYETGHIDFQGNVEIKGSVRGGFRVRATGDVVIAGSVETGAEIQAGGDVAVRQGIVGRQTTVRAEGSIVAKFVHDAHLQAGLDVRIGSYLHGAQVRASGQVVVEGLGGAGNSGGIIGGHTWALKGILSRNIGSERSTSTQLFAGLEPDQHARADQLARTICQSELMLQKLLKAVGLTALQADQIRKLVARNPARRSTILHYVKKANQLAQLRTRHVREQEELTARVTALAREAAIEVQDQAFARTILHIGDLQVVLTQDLRHLRFAIDPETGKIAWQELD